MDAGGEVGGCPRSGAGVAVATWVSGVADFRSALTNEAESWSWGWSRVDLLELRQGLVVVPLNHVVVRQEEVPGGGAGVGGDVGFQVAELAGVSVDVGVETDERRPVPPRSGREHGVLDGRGLVVTLEGEQRQGRNSWTTGTLGVSLIT